MPIADLIPHFYENLGSGYREEFRPGHLYWAPTFYLPPHPNVLFEVGNDPSERQLRFELRRATDDSFRHTHRPLKSIGLEVTEELVAIKAKRRLVVLLSEENTAPDDMRVAGRRKIHERSFLCLPLYGVHADEPSKAFPETVIERIQVLMYVQFFYFPASSRETSPVVYEAVGRLDRIQVFHRDTLAMGAIPLRLSDDCLLLLREWVRGYLTGAYSKDLNELRQELTKELYT